MRHKFKNLGSVQWAMSGLSYYDAKTDYECELCGIRFSHYYHKEPDIYKALKEAGIDIDGCSGKQEER